MEINSLKHYPSLKPEPLTFEKIKRDCVPTETVFLSKNGLRKKYLGFIYNEEGKCLLLVKKFSNYEPIEKWHEREIEDWHIMEEEI